MGRNDKSDATVAREGVAMRVGGVIPFFRGGPGANCNIEIKKKWEAINGEKVGGRDRNERVGGKNTEEGQTNRCGTTKGANNE